MVRPALQHQAQAIAADLQPSGGGILLRQAGPQRLGGIRAVQNPPNRLYRYLKPAQQEDSLHPPRVFRCEFPVAVFQAAGMEQPLLLVIGRRLPGGAGQPADFL